MIDTHVKTVQLKTRLSDDISSDGSHQGMQKSLPYFRLAFNRSTDETTRLTKERKNCESYGVFSDAKPRSVQAKAIHTAAMSAIKIDLICWGTNFSSLRGSLESPDLARSSFRYLSKSK